MFKWLTDLWEMIAGLFSRDERKKPEEPVTYPGPSEPDPIEPTEPTPSLPSVTIEDLAEASQFNKRLLGIAIQGLFRLNNRADKKFVWEDDNGKQFLERIPTNLMRGYAGTGSLGFQYNPTPAPGEEHKAIGYGYSPDSPDYTNKYEKHVVQLHTECVQATGKFNEYIYCHNVYSNADECINVIKDLEDKGIVVLAVELGNEYHLLGSKYRDPLPTFQSYVDWAKAERAAILAVYPNMKFSAPVANSLITGADEQQGNANQTAAEKWYEDWNRGLGDAVASGELPLEFISPHFYLQHKQVQYIADEGVPVMQDFVVERTKLWDNEFIKKQLFEYYGDLFPSCKFLVTEWSGGNGPYVISGNSMLRAMGGLRMLQSFIKNNHETGGRIAAANWQVVTSKNTAGLIQSSVNSENTIEPQQDWLPQVEFYMFDMFNHLQSFNQYLLQEYTLDMPEEQKSGVTFVTLTNGTQKALIFVNMSDSEVKLQGISGQRWAVKGPDLFASNGKSTIEENWSIVQEQVMFDHDEMTDVISPISFGFIKYE